MQKRWCPTTVLTFVLSISVVAPGLADWTRPQRIGGVPRTIRYLASRPAQIAVSGEMVHVVWLTELDGVPTIRYVRSLDCGEGWSVPVTLATIPMGVQNDVALAAAGGTVHVAWQEANEPEEFETSTFYARSLDWGETWTEKQRLSLDEQIGQYSPTFVVATGLEVYVVWKAEWLGRSRIVVAASTNEGATWSFDLPGSVRVPRSTWPAIGVQEETSRLSQQLVLAYAKAPERRKRISFRRSSGGAPWTVAGPLLRADPPRLEPWGGDLVWPVAVLPTRQGVDVLWGHGVAFKYGYIFHDLYYQSRDGSSWSEKRKVNGLEGHDAWDPAFTSVSGTLHAAWTDLRHVYVARSKDRGATWRRRRLRAGFVEGVAIAVSSATSGRCKKARHVVFGEAAEEESGLIYRRRPARLR